MTIIDQIRSEADRAQLHVTATQIDRIGDFITLLAHWAKRIRLTGSADAETIVQRHVIDAFWLATLIDDQTKAQCIDVGAGAGLPGMPFAILREQCAITLVEPNHKRVAFLSTAKMDLKLNVTIAPGRLEEVTVGAMDWAWSKATWSPEQWVTIGEPLVGKEGRVVVLLGQQKPPACPSTLQLDKVLHYSVSDGTPRALAVYRKVV